MKVTKPNELPGGVFNNPSQFVADRYLLIKFKFIVSSYHLVSKPQVELITGLRKSETRSTVRRYFQTAMDTHSSSELKKALDNLEAEKREMADQMKKLQEHIRELTMSNRRHLDESSSKTTLHEQQCFWPSNEIKVDIPKYDGRLDPDEFIEWLNTVERVFDYKQISEENKV
ncbi:hypothetical protein E3N88_46346 [Mikania micrantha]|uniref:Uncharacterized protein n=1 Tax=Mikania micrantha TaxID=192012 RepID=A0A5N6L8Y8_9ASTR|nr:hypothetical protein E3N88_46346 [Mikania micrantha]